MFNSLLALRLRISWEVLCGILFRTCARSSHSFRKSVDFTCQTKDDRNDYLNIHLSVNEDLMGHLAVAATGYFQDIVLGFVAGSLLENLVYLFYYYTAFYYVRMLFVTVIPSIIIEYAD